MSLLFQLFVCGRMMKVSNIAVALVACVTANPVFAQTTAPATPPTSVVLVTAPTPPEPTVPAVATPPKTAEGTLFKSQRMRNDKGTQDYICTYRIAGTKRDVLLDESCPESMVFQLKK